MNRNHYIRSDRNAWFHTSEPEPSLFDEVCLVLSVILAPFVFILGWAVL